MGRGGYQEDMGDAGRGQRASEADQVVEPEQAAEQREFGVLLRGVREPHGGGERAVEVWAGDSDGQQPRVEAELGVVCDRAGDGVHAVCRRPCAERDGGAAVRVVHLAVLVDAERQDRVRPVHRGVQGLRVREVCERDGAAARADRDAGCLFERQGHSCRNHVQE